MEITYETKVYDLLKAYPNMIEFLITLSPRYKKLKNPILKRTIARVASLRQASYLGGLTPQSLVNSLRAEVGQTPLEDNTKEEQTAQQKPAWANDANITEVNATKLLDEDKNPLSYTNKAFKKIATNGVILIRSDFIPSPLVDEMRAKGATVVVVETDNGWYETYVQKIK